MMNERIKKLRKALDLTQQEFAVRIGSTQNVVANYEIGRRNPSKSVINNICKTFHVNEDWLKTGAGDMFADVSRDEQITEFVQQTLSTKPDSFQRRFAAMLSTLSDSDWEVLERMAHTIIAERPAAALASEDTPPQEGKPLSIDEQVELYRQQLLLEEEREKQALSANGSGAG